MKQTYMITLELDTQIAEEYNKLSADYENLSAQEYQNFDFLSDAVFYGTEMLQLKPLVDTSIISWLPVNGTVPPTTMHYYLLTDGESTQQGMLSDEGKWIGAPITYRPTHYAELPTFTPVQAIPSYIQRHTCEACGEGFTLSEWDNRETPHEPDCPNYGQEPDEDGLQHHVDCTCDRNFHSRCYNADYQATDDLGHKIALTLRPDRFEVVE